MTPFDFSRVLKLKAARAFYVPLIVAVILLGSISASALTAWKETASDFPSGQSLNTRVESGALALAPDAALADNWTRMGDVSSPPPRYQHAMVYDPGRGANLMFGGYFSTWYRTDTWTYNLSRNKWSDAAPASSPGARTGHAMAYDGRNGATVMFGGLDGGGYRADTWSFNSSANGWLSLLPTTAPSARAFHSMAYDPGTGRVVIFGGRLNVGGSQYVNYGDTWTYEFTSNSWTNRTTATAPSPRYGQSMCYDAATGLIVLFGGRNDTDHFRDTWTYDPASNVWTNRNPPTSPPARMGAAMAGDAAGGTAVMFGGQGDANSFNDTWAYNATINSWASKLLAAGPSPRVSAAASYDPLMKKVVLFGGKEQGDVYMDDFWAYDAAQNAWTLQGQLSSPEPRFDHAMAFDGSNQVGVLFGGTDGTFTYGDTWTYDALANHWARKRTPLAPSPRRGAVMAYDRAGGVVVLFGGMREAAYLNDTWTYSVSSNAWTNRQPASPPPGGVGNCMAYDPTGRLHLLFGGGVAPGVSGNLTWTYSVADNLWTNRTGAVAPSSRYGADIDYDEAGHLFVLFGGSTSGGLLADTWVMDPATFAWTMRTPPASPAARTFHAMCYDTSAGVTMLFGGLGPTIDNLLGDSWSYNATTNIWTNLLPALAPAARDYPRLYHDTSTNATVLFGGSDGSARGDTWLYDLGGRMTSGTHTSIAKDTGGSAYFGKLQWEAAVPAGTVLKLQLRSGATQAEVEAKDFTGPDGTAATFFTASGARIPTAYNGSRWVQWRSYFDSDSILKTPTLTSVTVNYNLLQTVTVTSPLGGENWTGQQSINWSSSDPDNDALTVNIYLVGPSGSEPIATDIPAGDGSWLWDTTTEENGTYRIMLVARDGNGEIPLSANGTSGEFVIHHEGTGPPPVTNHPPGVMMIYPIDDAALTLQVPAMVKLQWNGTDEDGDPLNYTVYFANHSFNQSALPPPAAVTAQTFYNAVNLVDGAIYYWSIIANDGKANSTPAVWRFTVKIGIVNIPPHITSTPPTTATVGKEYVYQVAVSHSGTGNISYTLSSAIEGMYLNSTTGRLNWTPGPNQTGNAVVVINVTDGEGGYDEQRFTITVGAAQATGPSCMFISPRPGKIVRGVFTVRGTAVNGSFGILRVQVRIDGLDWKDVGRSAGNWSLDLNSKYLINGRHMIEVRAFDGRRYSDMTALDVFVRNPERDFVTDAFPVGGVMLLLVVVAAVFLLWHLILRKGGPPPLK